MDMLDSASFCANYDTLVPFKKAEDEHPRFSDYKARTAVNTQEERRRRILENQKKCRDESFNRSRGLLQDIVASDVPTTHEEAMECTQEVKKKSPLRYQNKLMLSEWLLEVPVELEDKWFMVPCPKGKRTLVVATKCGTKAYSKQGHLIDTFVSALPGGLDPLECKSYTVLDCIWDKLTETFYVLDVLAWNNQPLLDCETEFRFYWLKSKLAEMPQISEKSLNNPYPFVRLPYYDCQPVTIATVMDSYPMFPNNVPSLDGVLFYDSRVHYEPGETPLVGWLKPFMLPELLNIPVTLAYLEDRPVDYEGLLQYIKTNSNKRSPKEKRWRRRKRKSQGAEVMES